MGIVEFINAIFEKYFVWNWLMEKGANQRSKFIYKLSSCRFCLRFHLSVFILVLYGFYTGFDLGMLFIPFVCSGLTYSIERKNDL